MGDLVACVRGAIIQAQVQTVNVPLGQMWRFKILADCIFLGWALLRRIIKGHLSSLPCAHTRKENYSQAIASVGWDCVCWMWWGSVVLMSDDTNFAD